jgi:hypothetical protein
MAMPRWKSGVHTHLELNLEGPAVQLSRESVILRLSSTVLAELQCEKLLNAAVDSSFRKRDFIRTSYHLVSPPIDPFIALLPASPQFYDCAPQQS